jgi:hypothetical protein
MLVVSYGIFHERPRKIMALTPSKARAGIAALTVAADVVRYACVVATASESRLIRPAIKCRRTP